MEKYPFVNLSLVQIKGKTSKIKPQISFHMQFTLSFDDTHPFAAAARRNNRASILIVNKETNEPAASVTQQAAATREEIYLLADNIKDLVSGRSPLHRSGKALRTAQIVRDDATPAHEMHIAYHYKKEDGHSLGNCQHHPAATISVFPGYMPVFEKLFLANPDAQKIILDSISLEERRSQPRARDQKAAKPSSAQKPVL